MITSQSVPHFFNISIIKPLIKDFKKDTDSINNLYLLKICIIFISQKKHLKPLKKKQKAAALLTNNLSAYSQTVNNDHLTTKAISSFKSTTNSSKITKNEQRWLDLLKCIVVTDSIAKLNNITKLKLNEEDILEPCLSNMKFLSPEAFYNYQQFIKTTSLNYYDKETE
jgi:hypothetical protein